MKKPPKRKHLWVGITGGIGSGKSTVSRFFTESGYAVLSADEIARELTQAGAEALPEIQALFGTKTLLQDGSMDRSHLRNEIIRDPALRLKLEAILHPRIQALSKKKTDALFATGKKIVFYEAPLLFEAKSEKQLDKVICVHADDETRIERTMKRDNTSREKARKLLESQMPQAEKMKKADYLIENEDGVDVLRANALKVLAELKGLLA
ncbi:MAG: dephospho-CoA kinase [Bdellovibrionota bacterium]